VSAIAAARAQDVMRKAFEAYEAVGSLARIDDIAALVTQTLAHAKTIQRPASNVQDTRDTPAEPEARERWNATACVREAAEALTLAATDLETPFGNALQVLSLGPQSEAERALACALGAHALAKTPDEALERTAHNVLGFVAFTPFDPLVLVDRALGSRAAIFWSHVVSRLARKDADSLVASDRAERLVAVMALRASPSESARAALAELARTSSDLWLLNALCTHSSDASPAVHLEGDVAWLPSGRVATLALGISGILTALYIVRAASRIGLGYRHRANVAYCSHRLEITSTVRLAGRRLRERTVAFGPGAIDAVVRQARYPRLGLYAGLLAVIAGSALGMRTLVDGVIGESPSLALTGLGLIAAGIAMDLALRSLFPGVRAQVELCIYPRKGLPIRLAHVDADEADRLVAAFREDSAL